MRVRVIKSSIKGYVKNPLVLFLLKGFLFFLVWDLLIYDYLISSAMHDWVIYRLLDASRIVLNWFYGSCEVFGTELFINGIRCVHVGIPCNGIEVMGVFACIVLAYKARWIHKLWIIIVGCLMVFLLNTARIAILAGFIYHHQQRAFDINHKYVFNVILYGVMLLLFSVWSSRFGEKTNSIG